MHVLPQCCHSVAQLMYDSTEQQGDEEVGQLTGGQIDPRDLQTRPTPGKEKRHDTETLHEHHQKKKSCFSDFLLSSHRNFVVLNVNFIENFVFLRCLFIFFNNPGTFLQEQLVSEWKCLFMSACSKLTANFAEL